jgi:hypothetical protein
LTQRGAAAKLFVYSMPFKGTWKRDEESFSRAKENHAKEQNACNAAENPDF